MSKPFRFTAEMFRDVSYDESNLLQAVAERANSLLNEELVKCERVNTYCEHGVPDATWEWTLDATTPTHTALLWNMSPISSSVPTGPEKIEGEK